MKKVLFTLLITISVLGGNAQTSHALWINELIPNPGQGDNEYIEFYNSSRDPIQLDCYVIVSYFKSKQEQGKNSEEGVYVYDFPTGDAIQGLSHYLISSGNSVNFKGNANAITTYTPTDQTSFSNWNEPGTGGSLNKYVYQNENWQSPETMLSGFNDFIDDAFGMDATLMLFKISNGIVSFENGFIVNPPSSDFAGMVARLNSMKPLPIIPSGNCGSSAVSIDFRTIVFNNIDIITLKEAPGSGQGYAKKRDGLCGNWDKTSQGEFSPGTKNNIKTATSSLNTIQDFSCNTVSFTITPNNPATYPYLVQLFYDHPLTSILEATDEYINQYTASAPEQLSGSISVPNSNQPVLLAYQSATGCFENIVPLTSTCTVLPVRFKSFTAVRNKQKKEQVVLKWETASEENNRGFKVQRKTTGEWKDIAFVPSRTATGNSNSQLAYEYVDINGHYSASQYRLQQVDIDGKSEFSDVRTVMGTDQAGSVLIYPNPGINGKINVVFKEQHAVKQIIVNDASGRLIKQFPEVTDNMLTIEGLSKGYYIIRIIDRSTMATSVEKVIIN